VFSLPQSLCLWRSPLAPVRQVVALGKEAMVTRGLWLRIPFIMEQISSLSLSSGEDMGDDLFKDFAIPAGVPWRMSLKGQLCFCSPLFTCATSDRDRRQRNLRTASVWRTTDARNNERKVEAVAYGVLGTARDVVNPLDMVQERTRWNA
jgi:hypothetical protein